MTNFFMQEALSEAKKGAQTGEVPVGAILVHNKKIICRAHNLTESGSGILAHAEMLVLSEGLHLLGSRRLENCTLYVTLEPCPMCAGAILLAKPGQLYFGAYDAVAGACGGKNDLLRNTSIEVYGGIMEEECTALLKEFFKNLRKKDYEQTRSARL
ncbi:MAG: nucleoside deaminase [Ruminococcaceae bacterium]|nr:nucleoside deaminase [Oscillospiraceae bacterium]